MFLFFSSNESINLYKMDEKVLSESLAGVKGRAPAVITWTILDLVVVIPFVQLLFHDRKVWSEPRQE